VSRPPPQDPREATLRRLLRDARAEPSPDLDWSGIERRLLQQTKHAAPGAERSRHRLAWGTVAVAAAAALWLVGTPSPQGGSPSRPAEVSAVAPAVRDGDRLAIGSRIETTDSEAAVSHAGRASWTVSPNSSAVLTGRDERITLRLERGSVLSRVVPNPKPETFVVEAAGTRVAVHGTLFSVALAGGHVIVQVREGIVAVGPLEGVPAFLLTAGTTGDFAADGRSGSINGRAVRESKSRPTGAQKQTPSRVAATSASSALPPAPSAELPSEPAIDDIETGVARIVDASTDCFARFTQSAEGVQITVRTALSLKILDSGAVAEVDFQPPLSPAAEECATARLSEIRFAPSKQGSSVTRMLELKK
jgi:hypothetical protein